MPEARPYSGILGIEVDSDFTCIRAKVISTHQPFVNARADFIIKLIRHKINQLPGIW